MISQESSNVISVLKCLLCIGVVCIHSTFNEDSLGVAGNDISLFVNFSNIFVYEFLDKTCVPVFFVISGYLFFNNVSLFDKEAYSRKIKSRIKSLLIPYIIANCFFSLYGIITKRSLAFSISGFLDSFIGFSGYPADPPLWYIRDLMVLVLFSFVIYWLIRKLSYTIPLLLFICWVTFPLLNVLDISLFRGLVFFSLGAFISLKQKDLLSFFRVRQYGITYILLYVILLLLSVYFGYDPLSRLSSIVGVLFWFSIGYFLREKINAFCSNYVVTGSIFIYFYHYYLAILIPRFLMLIFGASPVKAFIFYIIGVIASCCILYLVYYLLNRYFKKFTSILVGYRI